MLSLEMAEAYQFSLPEAAELPGFTRWADGTTKSYSIHRGAMLCRNTRGFVLKTMTTKQR